MSYRNIDTSNFSQADLRAPAKFRDQHNRVWQCQIETKTQEPTGPIAPAFTAPLLPASKYIVVKDREAREIAIDYDRWAEDLKAAHDEWLLNALREATRLYRDRGHEMLQRREASLMEIVGQPPEDPRQPLAAKAGNRWVLGFANPKTGQPETKPKWAEQIFPEPVKLESVSFPNADEEFGNDDGASAADRTDQIDYPHMYAPGRWHLSAEHAQAVQAGVEQAFQGKRADAEAAAEERALHAPAGTSAAHASWEG